MHLVRRAGNKRLTTPSAAVTAAVSFLFVDIQLASCG
jgi:hypothetical protein